MFAGAFNVFARDGSLLIKLIVLATETSSKMASTLCEK